MRKFIQGGIWRKLHLRSFLNISWCDCKLPCAKLNRARLAPLTTSCRRTCIKSSSRRGELVWRRRSALPDSLSFGHNCCVMRLEHGSIKLLRRITGPPHPSRCRFPKRTSVSAHAGPTVKPSFVLRTGLSLLSSMGRSIVVDLQGQDHSTYTESVAVMRP